MKTIVTRFYIVDTSSKAAIVVQQLIRDLYVPEINCSPMRLKGLIFIGIHHFLDDFFSSFLPSFFPFAFLFSFIFLFLSYVLPTFSFHFLKEKTVDVRKGQRENKEDIKILFLGVKRHRKVKRPVKVIYFKEVEA